MSDEAEGAGGRGPRTWWQYVMVYPTLAVALISAFPTWSDMAFSFYHKISLASSAEAKKQRQFWMDHPLCTASRFDWFESANDVKIDGTICPNGNIFLRLNTPQGSYARGIYLDDIIEGSQASLGRDVLGLTAHAAARVDEEIARTLEATDQLRIAQAQAIVECQAFLDDGRTIKRRIRVAAQCFDELVDTFTGEIKETIPINCIEECEGRL